MSKLKQKIAAWIAGWNFCVVEREYLDDLEYRFSCVLNHVTTGMSKTNYTLEAMYVEIDEHTQELIDQAIADEYAEMQEGSG